MFVPSEIRIVPGAYGALAGSGEADGSGVPGGMFFAPHAASTASDAASTAEVAARRRVI
jgi:hypothetical protein